MFCPEPPRSGSGESGAELVVAVVVVVRLASRLAMLQKRAQHPIDTLKNVSRGCWTLAAEVALESGPKFDSAALGAS